MLMARPVMMATRVFDFIQTTDVQAQQQLSVLLDHFNLSFAALGGNAGAALQEWPQLSRVVMRDEVLRTLPPAELHSRALLHFHVNHFNILLLTCTSFGHGRGLDGLWCTKAPDFSQARERTLQR